MPQIGVFWYYSGVVFGRAVGLDKAADYGAGYLDSPNTHTHLWDCDRALLCDFPELYGSEYFSIPRGRVLWKLKTSTAEVLMDSVLFNDTIKQKIMEFFDLETTRVQWKTDSHYTTNSIEIDALFDD